MERFANLFFNEKTPVAKFSVDNNSILVLTVSGVYIQAPEQETLHFPLTSISSWGFLFFPLFTLKVLVFLTTI